MRVGPQNEKSSWSTQEFNKGTSKDIIQNDIVIVKSGYRIRIRIDKDTLAVEPINSSTKKINVYIVYDRNALPRNSTNNFKCKYCIFEATRLQKLEIKNIVAIG